VNYADDLVICCRAGAEQALAAMRRMMSSVAQSVMKPDETPLDRPRRPFRGKAQSNADRLGQLLLSGTSQQGL
jgi:hypothetical protein